MTQLADPAVRDASIQKIFDSCKNWGRWGDDDDLGTLNLITPSKVAQIGTLIVSGKHVSCALDFPT
jgi:hypothetical protein